MSINLTDGIERSFTFSGEINGQMNTYDAFYPTAKQLRPIQLGYARLQALDKEYSTVSIEDKKTRKKIEDEVTEVSKSIQKSFTELFKPHEGSMPIEDFLDNLPSNAKKKFDDMINTELLGN
jgi:hypothetical protein